MKLYPHNQEAYDKVMAHFAVSDRACVIAATGTGKSFIGGAVAEHFQNVLLVAPNVYVINQALSVNNNMTSMTYSWLSMQEDAPKGYDLIWLDEMHRVGAETWGEGVERLLEANPNAKILGTTATEYRALEKRDMSEELFPNDVVYRLDLVDAWAKRIHRVPKYVIGVKSLASVEKDYRVKIGNAKRLNSEQKQKASAMLDNLLLDWSRSYGVPQIIRKYIDKDVERMIVFAPTISKIEEIERELPIWFKEANIPLSSIYVVHSGMLSSVADKSMRDFENDNSKGVKILLSVDMLNEGVHVDRVDAVMLLRSTISKNLYMQQIGRCFSVGQKHQPIILDLADNLTNACEYDGIYSARERYISEAGAYVHEDERPDWSDDFIIVDTLKDTRDVIAKLSNLTSNMRSWDEIAQIIDEHYKKTGKLISKKDDESIGAYINMHRTPFYRERYPERIKFLEERGFVLNVEKVKYTFETALQSVIEYKKEYGKLPKSNHDGMRSLKNYMKVGRVPSDKLSVLEELGVSRKNYNDSWNDKFQEMKAVYDKTGSLDSLNKAQRGWIYSQMNRRIPLSEEQVKLLQSIGAFELEKHHKILIKDIDDVISFLNEWFKTNEYFPTQNVNGNVYSYLRNHYNAKDDVWDRLKSLGYDESKFQPKKKSRLDIVKDFYNTNGRLPIEGESAYKEFVSLTKSMDANIKKALTDMGYVKVYFVDEAFERGFEVFKKWVKEHGYKPSSHRSEEETKMHKWMVNNTSNGHKFRDKVLDFIKDYEYSYYDAKKEMLKEDMNKDFELVVGYMKTHDELPPVDSEMGVIINRVVLYKPFYDKVRVLFERFCLSNATGWYASVFNYQELFKFYDANGRFPVCSDNTYLYNVLMNAKRHKRNGTYKRYTDRIEALGYDLSIVPVSSYEEYKARVFEHIKKYNGVIPPSSVDEKANKDMNNFRCKHRDAYEEMLNNVPLT